MPEWWEVALNGASVRVASPWRRGDLAVDDMIAGTLISRGPSSFVVAVERGTFQGEAIEPGEWKRVTPADAQIIETWLARDEPQVGDRVALRYRGIRGGKDGRRVTSHLFDCGTYREPVAEPAPAEPSW